MARQTHCPECDRVVEEHDAAAYDDECQECWLRWHETNNPGCECSDPPAPLVER